MIRIASLLAFAITAALAAPTASAQPMGGPAGISAQNGAASQAAEATRAAAQTDVAAEAASRTGDTTQSTDAGQQRQPLNAITPPPVSEVEEAAMNPPRLSPEPAQGGRNAAPHSAAAQRALWSELDANGDGRISAVEGGVNADFKAAFEMMDADHDGFISDAEYRTHSQATHPQTRDDAVRRDPTLNDDRTDAVDAVRAKQTGAKARKTGRGGRD